MTRSDDLFADATRLIPGGVNSPVRAFGAVGGIPRFIVRGDGAYLVDVDGGRLIDYVQSWGASLFGHARLEIVDAAVEAVRRGSSFGAPTEGEVLLAARIVEAVPSVEMVRLVSSGTEACMTAVRLARALTGRPKILKFEGCYHGHSDALLAKAGSGVATFGLPGSPGVTPAAAADTLVAPYNDLDAVAGAFVGLGDQIACVIVEPVAANTGVVPPVPGFLQGLRHLCDEHGSVLIFDEVITGFRIARGGAQQLYAVMPDLTCLGKVVGGGFPLAAVGGRAELMDRLAPAGDVYQAGTLSGNPVAVAAGLVALKLIERNDAYGGLRTSAERLTAGISERLGDVGVPHAVNRVESLFSVFFSDHPVRNHADAAAADHGRYARFFQGMLSEGVYLPPSGYEAWFLTTAHGEDELERTLDAAAQAAGGCVSD
jgi:glutamate-1-semialdehyde 2,1-aminomutase